MTLVRGSTDRLKLEWSSQHQAVGDDGVHYMIQTEQVRGEPVMHYAEVYRTGGGSVYTPGECPYGHEASVREQKKVCEWVAWVRAGRPSA